ncbi:GIY-YIG nuclease family protein [Phenylobacterium terrae]|uniref:GIY-YIG nuclease family protein n=1 Tax=Phenylobacterium terrae TaxID=2665495 RepID=A0ABW4MYE5_9CAUL
MDRPNRKALVAAYKEKKTVAGVYAVICNATGQAWVGQSRHIDTQQNGLWFTLRLGSCRTPTLQAAWREHGEAEFRYEQLDRLADDLSDFARADELKKRAAMWIARLQATPLA